MSESLRKYIEDRCIPVPFIGCWFWLLSTGSHGYGNAFDGTTVRTAPRLSFVAFKGPIPDGMLVQHSCDEKLCVNPDHLSLGTDKTNAEDKMRKGRGNYEGRIYPPHPGRKLTEQDADLIRGSTEVQSDLAARFGVSQRVIWAIKSGRSYKPVAHHRPAGKCIFVDAASGEIKKSRAG